MDKKQYYEIPDNIVIITHYAIHNGSRDLIPLGITIKVSEITELKKKLANENNLKKGQSIHLTIKET